MFMNNFTKSGGNAYWHAITNLTCCNVDLKKTQLFKTIMVLMIFAFSSTMFAQERTTFYEVCVADRPEGLTVEQAINLFPEVECEGTLSVEKIENLQGGDCGWVSVYEYILKCDGEPVAEEKLIYEGGDLEAPKLEIPADVTVECDAIPDPGTPTATDNCDQDVEITLVSDERVGDDDCSYTIVRTWTATDNCGLTDTKTQTITVLDTTGPELKKGAEVPTGETGLNVCYSALPQGPSELEIAALFSDNCGDVMVTKERVFKGTDCMWKGYINYYVSDNCGNPGDTISLYYNGGDTEAPVFVDAPGNIEVSCIDLIPANYVLAWTDNCSESNPKTKDQGIDDTTNLGEACEGGSMTRTWTVQDSCGNEVTHTQTITVMPAPDVVFDNLDNIDILCEDLAAFQAGTLYYSNGGSGACDINGYAQGIAEDFTDNCGSFTVTYTYSDTCNDLVFVQTITVIDDVKPVLIIPADETVECDSVPDVGAASATDNCDANVDLKYDGEDRTDGNCDDSYTLKRTWTATDSCGNITTLTQVITVVDTTDPVLTIPADETVECDNVPSVEDAIVTATDNCDLEVEIAFVEDKIEMGDDDCANTYVIYRIWRATDNCDNTVLETQKITVVDTTKPVLTVPANLTVECDMVPDAPVEGDATATDNCDLNVVVVYNGQERTDGSCVDTYTLTRSWTATDCAGNSTTETQTINVQDTTDPTIVVPVDVTVECDMLPSLEEAIVTASDNCDKEVSIRFVDEKRTDGACTDSYTLERTWEAEDNCGNTMTGTQTITVQDTTKPILIVPANETVECDAVPALEDAIVSASDNCDANVTIEFVREDRENGDCPNNYALYRIWLATDNCGNAVTKTQIIIVLDRTAPTFTAPGDITIYTDENCDYDASTSETGNASNEADNCSEGLKATYEDNVDEGQCEGEKIITRTWSLMDECGNEADDQVQIITVKDMIVPTFTAPDDITIYTDENCDYDAVPDATGDVTNEADNCSTEINAEYTDDVKEGSCEGEYYIERTWSLVDNCGNEAEDQVQIITVKDMIVPTFTAPDDITIYTDENCDYDASIGVTGDVSDEADNCTSELNAMYTDDVKEGSCEGEKIIERTWTLVDNCGNEAAEQVQTITVKDNIKPTFKAPADMDLDCADDTSIANTGDVTDEADNCTSELEARYADEVVAGNCAGNYVILRTWSLVDNCNNAADDQVQTITVTDTTAPVLIGVIPESINEINGCASQAPTPLTEAEFALLFRDNCSKVVVSLFSSPVGDDCGWSIIHIYTVSDECGNLLGDFKVYYSGEDLTAPVLNDVPADITISCEEEERLGVEQYVTASDNCDANVDIKFDQDFYYYDGDCKNFDIINTWTATDACGNTVTESQTIQVRDMEAPVLTGVLPEGSNGNDLCAPNTDEVLAELGVLTELEFALLYTDNCNGVIVNRVINLNGDDCKWIMWVRYDITDYCGNEAQSVKLWYHGADMTAPDIDEATDVTVECDGTDDVLNAWVASNGNNTAKDKCSDVTWSNDYDDKSTVGDSCSNTTTVTFTATDACGNESSTTSTFTVEDTTKPYFTSTPPPFENMELECGDELPQYEVTANDVCQGEIIPTYTEKECYGLPDPTDMEADHDHTAYGVDNGCLVECVERKWIIEDGCGNKRVKKQYVAFYDTTAPEAPEAPADITVECGDAIPAAVALKAYDSCQDTEYDGVATDSQPEVDGCKEIITRTWTFTDACGNASTVSQLITIDDTVAPVITCPADVDFGLVESTPGTFATEPNSVSDNCDDNVDVTFEDYDHLNYVPGENENPSSVITFTCSYFYNNWRAFEFVTFTQDGEANGKAYYPNSGIYSLSYSNGKWRLKRNSDTVATNHNDDFYPDCNESGYGADWAEYDTDCRVIKAQCQGGDQQSPGITHFSKVRTFTAIDACGNKSACDVMYTWSLEGDYTNNVQTSQAAPDQSEDMGVELDFTAYPVPFDSDVNVKFNFEFDTDVTIEIHDTKGLLVKSMTINGVRKGSDTTRKFDLSKGADQLFYITVTTNQGSVTKKVVSSMIKRR
jgi:hypothetical protein